MAGVTADVRPILPAKLNVLVRVTVIAAPVAPELKFTGLLTDSVKLPTWTVDAAEWEAVPGEPVPVMETEYVPAVVDARVHDAVTVAFAVILVAVVGQVTVRPVTGVTTEDRLMLPAKF